MHGRLQKGFIGYFGFGSRSDLSDHVDTDSSFLKHVSCLNTPESSLKEVKDQAQQTQ